MRCYCVRFYKAFITEWDRHPGLLKYVQALWRPPVQSCPDGIRIGEICGREGIGSEDKGRDKAAALLYTLTTLAWLDLERYGELRTLPDALRQTPPELGCFVASRLGQFPGVRDDAVALRNLQEAIGGTG